MIDMMAVEQSKKNYEEAKEYFTALKLSDCVIDASFQKPMSKWPVHFTPTDEEMKQKRTDLFLQEKPFLAIHSESDGKYFFYTDSYITISENLTTGEIVLSDIDEPDEFNMKEIVCELNALLKQLQGI